MRGYSPPNWKLAETRQAAVRLLVWLLSVLLAVLPVPAQTADGAPGAGNTPTRLKIQVLTEAPLTEFAGVLSANSLQVRIVDNWDMPVRGATVSFRLPETGPGGVFVNGLSSEIAVTNDRGEASVQGFDWRPEAGVTFVHVIAAYGAIRAGAMVEVQLARKVRQWPETVADPPDRVQLQQRSPAKPLPAESVGVSQRTVLANPSKAGAEPLPAPPILGQQAEAQPLEDRRSALLPPISRSPREETAAPEASSVPPMVRVKGQAPRGGATAQNQRDSYVKVRQGRQGGGKVMLWVLVAGAAAGGALAASMASGGGASNGNGGNVPLPPVIRIGTPTITITGGN